MPLTIVSGFRCWRTKVRKKASGVDYKTKSFPFAGNGRAKAMVQTSGMVKILSSIENDPILGIHFLGPMAGGLISKGVLTLEFATSTEDPQRTINAHPSLAEAFHETSLAVDNKALNFPNRSRSMMLGAKVHTHAVGRHADQVFQVPGESVPL